jgi:FlaA1/EpsC-like NDP-sugar epimerase
MVKASRVAVLILTDFICINIAYIIAFLLRFEFDIYSDMFTSHLDVYIDNLVLISFLKILVIALFGLYNSLWKYAGTEEVIKVISAAIGCFAVVFLYLSLTQQLIPRGVQGICFFLDIIFIGGSRIGYRTLRNLHHPRCLNKLKYMVRRNSTGKIKVERIIKRVLIIGAGDAGASMIKEIRLNPESGRNVVAVIDDDLDKKGKYIVGKKIIGNRKHIAKAVETYKVNEIIIAIPSASKRVIQEIVSECNKTGCKLKILPAYIDLIDGRVKTSNLRDVAIEDLLGRESIQTDLCEIVNYIEGRIVLVTGGGGSIGSELCRQLANYSPRKLIALDIYENSLFELADEIKNLHPEQAFEAIVASVRNKDRMEEIFEKYKPHVVFHAAAHKHVPLMEKSPKEAILNNIIGTKNMIDLAHDNVVEKFVLISTDKAVNPTNVMGATKRVAEMLMQDKSYKSLTCFSAVRFGNVLGSNGSVLPLFRKQIEKGGPVTITHKDITRYFMTIPEAVQLVIQTGAMADGGEIFILDMGEAVKIMDLAKNLITLSGYIPNVDIEIEVVGLRPGEKLFEELLLDEEGIMKTTHDHIYVGHPVTPTPILAKLLDEGDNSLYKAALEICRLTDEDAKEWLRQLVPNYSNGNGNGSESEKLV